MKITGKLSNPHHYAIFDGLTFAAASDVSEPSDVSDSPAVEFGADGVPIAWRLLKAGVNVLEQGGESPLRIEFEPVDFAQIVEATARKGTKIPIDSRHAVYLAAKKHGVSEEEVLRMIPHGTAALGYASGFDARPDGIWIVGVEWTALARELVKDGFFRYYSPVIRGIGTDALRITSVALDNVPGFNDLTEIAAGAEVAVPAANHHPNQKETGMDKQVLKAIGAILGDATIAAGAEPDEPGLAPRLEALAVELPVLRTKAAKCDELVAAAELTEHDAMIAGALKSGKFSNADKDKFAKLGKEQLASVLAAMPDNAVVATANLVQPKMENESDPELTATDIEAAKKLGIDPEEMKKTKKEQKKC